MISFNLFLIGLSLAYAPFASPSFALLYVDLIVNDIFLQTLESNPLSIDYAPRQAQGRAYSLNSMGMNLGVIVGAGLFVSLIKYFELATHYKLIYFISGMIVVAFSLLTPFLIIEPPDLK